MLEHLFSRLFVPWNFCSHDGTFVFVTVPWTVCSLDRSFLGTFVPGKLSFPGTFVSENK